MMNDESNNYDAQREMVAASFNDAEKTNKYNYSQGDDKATSEYIYGNQKEDAAKVVEMFVGGKKVVSVQKKTKIGADGLMLEIAKQMTTHPDNKFVRDIKSVRMITGMSNKSWENDMIDKSPTCLKKNIFHHGKLGRAELANLRNALVFIDEIDTGDKPGQKLHSVLKQSGIFDVNHMKEHNNIFVLISATMLKELYDLYKWGDVHGLVKMTIPPSYIGHIDFLDKGIIQEAYSLKNEEAAERWIREDILGHYGPDDHRIHICRSTRKNSDIIENACIKNGVEFRNHDSGDRITEDDLRSLFSAPRLPYHVVVMVKGFLRRANLIPDAWKKRIGAIHENSTAKVDNNVQVQGLLGRMTGYWRYIIEGGHKTGPYRASVKAIREYETCYQNPFGVNNYQSSGFKKTKGEVTSKDTMLSPRHVPNLDYDEPEPVAAPQRPTLDYRVAKDEAEARALCTFLGQRFWKLNDKSLDSHGFYKTSLNATSAVASLDQAISKVQGGWGGGGARRAKFVCYEDITDNTTMRIVVIVEEGNAAKAAEWDTTHTPVV